MCKVPMSRSKICIIHINEVRQMARDRKQKENYYLCNRRTEVTTLFKSEWNANSRPRIKRPGGTIILRPYQRYDRKFPGPLMKIRSSGNRRFFELLGRVSVIRHATCCFGALPAEYLQVCGRFAHLWLSASSKLHIHKSLHFWTSAWNCIWIPTTLELWKHCDSCLINHLLMT